MQSSWHGQAAAPRSADSHHSKSWSQLKTECTKGKKQVRKRDKRGRIKKNAKMARRTHKKDKVGKELCNTQRSIYETTEQQQLQF